MRTESAQISRSYPHADGKYPEFVRTERPEFQDFGSDLCPHTQGSWRDPRLNFWVAPNFRTPERRRSALSMSVNYAAPAVLETRY